MNKKRKIYIFLIFELSVEWALVKNPVIDIKINQKGRLSTNNTYSRVTFIFLRIGVFDARNSNFLIPIS